MPLAADLPALIAAAEATAHGTTVEHQVLAESYNLATRVLIKLEASGLESLSADHLDIHGQRPCPKHLRLVVRTRQTRPHPLRHDHDPRHPDRVAG